MPGSLLERKKENRSLTEKSLNRGTDNDPVLCLGRWEDPEPASPWNLEPIVRGCGLVTDLAYPAFNVIAGQQP